MFRSTNPIRGSPSPSFRNESFLFFSQLAGDSSKKLVVDNDKIVIELSLERTNFSEKLRGTHEGGGRGDRKYRSCRAAHELLYVHTVHASAVAVSAIAADREREREGYRWTQAPCVPRTSLRTSNKTSRRRRLSTG